MKRAVLATALGSCHACTFVGDLGIDTDGSPTASAGTEGADATDGQPTGSGSDGGSGDGDGTAGLPALPELYNVRVRLDGDAATVDFDPFPGAVDYRIYPLPSADDVVVDPDGVVTIADGTYRCAGRRESLYMLEEILNPEAGWNDSAAGGSTTIDRAVENFARTAADAQLGWVYPTGGPGRVPVYALGSNALERDGWLACERAIFASNRAKHYTTDASERAALLDARWRDDGIAFWVPTADADPGVARRTIREGLFGDDTLLRWVDGPEGDVRGPGTPLLDVLADPTPDAIELWRIHEVPYCTPAHDELVAGQERFDKVRREGDHPLTKVRWAGLTAATTLVVEALDSGCPYQGNLSPGSEAPFVEGAFSYEGYTTIDDMRAASPTGEVFVNGQYDTSTRPRAIARSFVDVAPALPTDLDMFATFPATEDLRATFGPPTGNVYAQHFESADYTLSSYQVSHLHFGSFLGELWLAYNDIEGVVSSWVHLTANEPADLSAGYLHVTSELSMVVTNRRYPQVLISDRTPPIQSALVDGTTLVVQPYGYAPGHLQVQICDHRTWDPSGQCPLLPLFSTDAASNATLPAENAGADASMRLDIYLSSDRLYLLLDDAPYACTLLPALADDGSTAAAPSGPVTVTWGDVLAHSDNDYSIGTGPITGESYRFHREHLRHTARRHFDNLGFASGVAAPAWDETRVPCIGS